MISACERFVGTGGGYLYGLLSLLDADNEWFLQNNGASPNTLSLRITGQAAYYRNNVIGGPGAFVMVAKDFNSFGQAMIGKLIAEVAENRLPKQTHYSAR